MHSWVSYCVRPPSPGLSSPHRLADFSRGSGFPGSVSAVPQTPRGARWVSACQHPPTGPGCAHVYPACPSPPRPLSHQPGPEHRFPIEVKAFPIRAFLFPINNFLNVSRGFPFKNNLFVDVGAGTIVLARSLAFPVPALPGGELAGPVGQDEGGRALPALCPEGSSAHAPPLCTNTGGAVCDGNF